jgi:hypothetical protein
MFRISLLKVLAISKNISLAFFCIASSPAGASAVWDEKPLASVQVGLDSDGTTPIYRTMVVGILGPESPVGPSGVWNKNTSCASSSLTDALVRIQKRLDADVLPFSRLSEEVTTIGREVTEHSLADQLKSLESAGIDLFSLTNAELRY